MKVILLVALAVGALCQVPRAAHAQERIAPEAAATPTSAHDTETPPDPGTPDTHARWYGWQTLTADVGSVGVIALGITSRTGAPIILGLVGYVFVTPIIFAAHQSDRWLSSMLLRLAVPALMFTGALMDFGSCFEQSSCDETPAYIVATAGLVLGVSMPIVDAVSAVDKPRSAAQSGVAITPWVAPHADAAGLALSGRL